MCLTKYYYFEHDTAYRQIESEHKANWDALHEESTSFDDFASRAFLTEALARLRLNPSCTDVLEYGCGTGSGACFFAARGFHVDAIDLIPRAVALARRFAAERALEISFAVQDVCALADVRPTKFYDLVVDTYCLQSIVRDEDRAGVFAAVRARLNPDAHYLISSAMYDPARRYIDGEDVYDDATGIVLSRLGGEAERHRQSEGAVQIGGRWYLPHRRHLKPEALAGELNRSGFHVVWQGGAFGGEVICIGA